VPDLAAAPRYGEVPDAPEKQQRNERKYLLVLECLERLLVPESEVVEDYADDGPDDERPHDLGRVDERFSRRPKRHEKGGDEIGGYGTEHNGHAITAASVDSPWV
jgi:hypothetical protein